MHRLPFAAFDCDDHGNEADDALARHTDRAEIRRGLHDDAGGLVAPSPL